MIIVLFTGPLIIARSHRIHFHVLAPAKESERHTKRAREIEKQTERENKRDKEIERQTERERQRQRDR